MRFDTYRILQRHCVVSLPQHGFLVGLCLQSADNAGLLSKVTEELATKIAKKSSSTTHCHLTPPPWGNPANIRIYFIFLETRIIDLYYSLIVWVSIHLDFSGGLHKTHLFARVRISRSRSSKVINFGTNRKHIYDLLLIRHSNLGPILHTIPF